MLRLALQERRWQAVAEQAKTQQPLLDSPEFVPAICSAFGELGSHMIRLHSNLTQSSRRSGSKDNRLIMAFDRVYRTAPRCT